MAAAGGDDDDDDGGVDGGGGEGGGYEILTNYEVKVFYVNFILAVPVVAVADIPWSQ